MDYSFIDKLLERYWQCATSLEEEEMLKAFFRQKEIQQRFEQYRSLFNYEDLAASEHLGADFVEKMIRMVEQPVVRARRIPFAVRFRPFFKAAAAVAIVLTLGNAAQHSFKNNDTTASLLSSSESVSEVMILMLFTPSVHSFSPFRLPLSSIPASVLSIFGPTVTHFTSSLSEQLSMNRAAKSCALCAQEHKAKIHAGKKVNSLFIERS